MKLVSLLALTAVFAVPSSASASVPAAGESCPPTACDSACCCKEICPLPGETTPAAQKRQMSAELLRLVSRYVSDAKLRSELREAATAQPVRVLNHAALRDAKLSESDRVCLKRLVDYFEC